MICSAATDGSTSPKTPEQLDHSTEEPEAAQPPKLFILDTNVILHDAECLFKFHEHNIALPITVLEELDRFKKGESDIHFQARRFLRSLDQLADNLMCDEGASLGDLRARLIILGAVEAAHRNQQISSNMRYEILQSLFPAVEARHSNAIDFRVCRTVPNPELVAVRFASHHDRSASQAPNRALNTGKQAAVGHDPVTIDRWAGQSQCVPV